MIDWLKNNLPNFLTCINLLCGITGIFLLAEQGLQKTDWIEYLVLIAGLADFVDGFAARLLKSTSAIGKDLDSLADCVTFGALPALLLFLSMQKEGLGYLSYSAALIAVFSGVRLAIFNNDSGQRDQFIGMPTPANAFFIVFLSGSLLNSGSQIPGWFFPALALFTAFWLIMPVPLLALKFKSFSLKKNWPRFLVLSLSLLGILFFGKLGIAMSVLSYLAVSIFILIFSDHAVQSQG
jgi:CDP-diacylglycerol--serine O-phosphatidyltransferase